MNWTFRWHRSETRCGPIHERTTMLSHYVRRLLQLNNIKIQTNAIDSIHRKNVLLSRFMFMCCRDDGISLQLIFAVKCSQALTRDIFKLISVLRLSLFLVSTLDFINMRRYKNVRLNRVDTERMDSGIKDKNVRKQNSSAVVRLVNIV